LKLSTATKTAIKFLAVLILGACTAVTAANLIDLAHQVKGVLPLANGGTNSSSATVLAHKFFGNNTGSTAAPGYAQPACGDLSNAAASCATDATSASNITSGTLGSARLPGPFNSMLAPSSVTAPSAGSFTWGNQGSATATANAGGALYLTAPTNSGSHNLNFLYKATPATPWSVIAGYVITPNFKSDSVDDLTIAGLALRESGTNEIISFSFGHNGGVQDGTEYITKWDSYTSINGNYVAQPFGPLPPVIWVKLSDDGANLTFYISPDGQNFSQVWQKSRTDFFTSGPNQVGMFVDSLSSTTQILFVHWSGV
jgi:hypothetical protein